MAQLSFQQLTLTGNIVMQWPFAFTTPPLLLDKNFISTASNGYTITFPDATLAQPGETVEINNMSAFTFTVLANDGVTPIYTFTAGLIAVITLTDNSTTNGTWNIVPIQSSGSGIIAFEIESSDSSINVVTTPSGGTILPPGGLINVTMLPSLSNLNAVNTTGFLTIQSVSPLTFQPQTLIAGESIVITNPDGVGGEAVINLANVVGPISSLEVGDMTLTGEIITNNLANGNIQLNSNGTGNVQINGVQIDVNGNITGVNNFVPPAAWVLFTDVRVITNTITIEAETNIASVTGSNGNYVLTFTTPFLDTNYGVHLDFGTSGAPDFLVKHGYWLVKTTTDVTIIVLDQNGVLVDSCPDGVSVLIMAMA